MNKFPKEIPDDTQEIYEIDAIDFQESGGLWLCNSILYHFGLVILIDHRTNGDSVLVAARTTHCGFDHHTTESGARRMRNFLSQTTLRPSMPKKLNFVQKLRKLGHAHKFTL